jgi:hypothetical protein
VTGGGATPESAPPIPSPEEAADFSIASAASRTFITGNVGPNVSSRTQSMLWSTSTSTVGAANDLCGGRTSDQHFPAPIVYMISSIYGVDLHCAPQQPSCQLARASRKATARHDRQLTVLSIGRPENASENLESRRRVRDPLRCNARDR